MDGIKERKPVLHCWEYGPERDDGMTTTCVREQGHRGPHEWTRDDRIMFTFPPLPKEKANG